MYLVSVFNLNTEIIIFIYFDFNTKVCFHYINPKVEVKISFIRCGGNNNR